MAAPTSPSASISDIRSVAVIGAGQMGTGIAQVCASAGFDVWLNDLSAERVDAGLTKISAGISRLVAKQSLDEETGQKIVARLKPAVELNLIGQCDLVIEAATENEDVKRTILQSICPVLGPNAILSTNTSSISITRLASYTDRPARFIGLHFMNPVPVMKLVEIIRGIATDEICFQSTRGFVERLEKSPVTSSDYPAFIVNRILLPMINEAIYALYEGVGDITSIDQAMRLGANHPMGPLQLADFIGLDTCLSIMQVLHEGLADSKYRPCPLLVKYVEAGWFGRKSGRGFYDYGQEPPVPSR